MKIKVDNTKILKYIDTLINLKIIEKIWPKSIGKSWRGSVFKISDNFFRFWYKFVFENRELIKLVLQDDIFLKNVNEPII